MAGLEDIAVERCSCPKTSKPNSAVYGGRLDDPRALGDSWDGEEQNLSGAVGRRRWKRKIDPGRKTPKLSCSDLGFPMTFGGG